MNLVDSCGWLEYFADGPHADFYALPRFAQSQTRADNSARFPTFQGPIGHADNSAVALVDLLIPQNSNDALESYPNEIT